MRAEVYPHLIRVTLSERNLLTLVYKLRHQNGTKGMISGDVHVRGNAVNGLFLTLGVEPDAAHYGDREPGEFDEATESFVADIYDDLIRDGREPVGALLDLKVGPCGRMISGSKSGFHSAYPDHAAVFNANIFAAADGASPVKVWHGDLDLTVDEPALVQVAAACGETLYVLFEGDGRFGDRETKPGLQNAALRISPDGSTVIREDGFTRGEDGSLRFGRANVGGPVDADAGS